MTKPGNVLLSVIPAENGEIKVFLWDGQILVESETGDRRGQVVQTGSRRTVTLELTPRTAAVLVAILEVAIAEAGRRVDAEVPKVGVAP
jgi:hypothetical protein